MNQLQKSVIAAAEAVATRYGRVAVISGPKFSEDFQAEYFAFDIRGEGLKGLIFPADANFWDDVGLDCRFERVAFDSDDAMCRTIVESLVKALARGS